MTNDPKWLFIRTPGAGSVALRSDINSTKSGNACSYSKTSLGNVQNRSVSSFANSYLTADFGLSDAWGRVYLLNNVESDTLGCKYSLSKTESDALVKALSRISPLPAAGSDTLHSVLLSPAHADGYKNENLVATNSSDGVLFALMVLYLVNVTVVEIN